MQVAYLNLDLVDTVPETQTLRSRCLQGDHLAKELGKQVEEGNNKAKGDILIVLVAVSLVLEHLGGEGQGGAETKDIQTDGNRFCWRLSSNQGSSILEY